MTRRSQSLIVVTVSRWLARLIQIFAFYVVFHGHYSPGGGFQGGALLAASLLLMRLAEGHEESQSEFPSELGPPLSSAGPLVFVGVGCLACLAGGMFLDYGSLTWLGHETAARRSLGILLVEIGIAGTVTAALVTIFDQLATKEQHE